MMDEIFEIRTVDQIIEEYKISLPEQKEVYGKKMYVAMDDMIELVCDMYKKYENLYDYLRGQR